MAPPKAKLICIWPEGQLIHPVRLHWRKLNWFSLCQWVSVADSFLGKDTCVHFPLSGLGTRFGWNLGRSHMCFSSLCEFTCASGWKTLSSWSRPSLALTMLLPPLLHTSWSSGGRGLRKTSCLGLGAPKSVTLCTLSRGGSLLHSFLVGLIFYNSPSQDGNTKTKWMRPRLVKP